jgi:hypothetical protein
MSLAVWSATDRQNRELTLRVIPVGRLSLSGDLGADEQDHAQGAAELDDLLDDLAGFLAVLRRHQFLDLVNERHERVQAGILERRQLRRHLVLRCLTEPGVVLDALGAAAAFVVEPVHERVARGQRVVIEAVAVLGQQPGELREVTHALQLVAAQLHPRVERGGQHEVAQGEGLA